MKKLSTALYQAHLRNCCFTSRCQPVCSGLVSMISFEDAAICAMILISPSNLLTVKSLQQVRSQNYVVTYVKNTFWISTCCPDKELCLSITINEVADISGKVTQSLWRPRTYQTDLTLHTFRRDNISGVFIEFHKTNVVSGLFNISNDLCDEILSNKSYAYFENASEIYQSDSRLEAHIRNNKLEVALRGVVDFEIRIILSLIDVKRILKENV